MSMYVILRMHAQHPQLFSHTATQAPTNSKQAQSPNPSSKWIISSLIYTFSDCISIFACSALL